MNFILKLFVIPFLLLLSACNPSMMEINLYTSDFDSVKNGEIIEVPVKVSFQMMGEDKKNLLEKAKNTAAKHLHPKSKFTISKGKYSNYFIVDTFIPMLKADDKVIKPYFKKNFNVAALYYFPKYTQRGSDKIEFVFQKNMANVLNKKLRKINMMLSLQNPPKKLKLRVISDSKQQIRVGANSAWISKKPYLSKVIPLKRREEVIFVFKGGSDSVYSKIPAHIYVINK